MISIKVFYVVNQKWFIALILFPFLFNLSDAEGANRFTTAVSLTERYEDNIYFTKLERVEGFITTILYKAAFSYEGVKGNASISYQAGFESELKNSDIDATRQIGMANFDYQLSQRFNLKLTDRFTLTPDSTEVSTTGIQVRRNDSYSNTFSTDISAQTSNFVTLRTGYTNQVVEFDNPSFSDSVSHGINAGLDYQFTRWDTLNFTYNYRYFITDIPKRTVLHSVSIKERHDFSPTFFISMNIGTTYLTDADKYRLLIGIDFNKSTKVTKIIIGYRMDVAIDSGITGETLINQRLSVKVTKELSKDLITNVEGNYSTNESLAGKAVDIESYTFRIGAGYTFTQWLTGNINYLFFQQDSHGQLGEDIRRNQIQVGLTATYQTPQ